MQIVKMLKSFIFLFIFFHFIKIDNSFGISREEFEKFKKQDIQEFLHAGDRIYQRRVGPPINDKYFRGSNLIYDCQKRHFACVIEDNYIECQNTKEQEFQKKATRFSCVPLLKFTTQKECFEKQMRAVETVVNREFCLGKYDY